MFFSPVICALQSNPYYIGLDYIMLLSVYLLIPNWLVFRTLPCLLFSLASLIEQRCQNPVLSGTDFSILLISLLICQRPGICSLCPASTGARRKQYEVQVRALELRKRPDSERTFG